MSYIKSKTDAIREEAKQYSWKTLREFEKIFPCANAKGLVEVYTKEYTDDTGCFPEYLEMESSEDFWRRWNKFKKLKAFL